MKTDNSKVIAALEAEITAANAEIERLRKAAQEMLEPVPDGEAWSKCLVRRKNQLKQALATSRSLADQASREGGEGNNGGKKR